MLELYINKPPNELIAAANQTPFQERPKEETPQQELYGQTPRSAQLLVRLEQVRRRAADASNRDDKDQAIRDQDNLQSLTQFFNGRLSTWGKGLKESKSWEDATRLLKNLMFFKDYISKLPRLKERSMQNAKDARRQWLEKMGVSLGEVVVRIIRDPKERNPTTNKRIKEVAEDEKNRSVAEYITLLNDTIQKILNNENIDDPKDVLSNLLLLKNSPKQRIRQALRDARTGVLNNHQELQQLARFDKNKFQLDASELALAYIINYLSDKVYPDTKADSV